MARTSSVSSNTSGRRPSAGTIASLKSAMAASPNLRATANGMPNSAVLNVDALPVPPPPLSVLLFRTPVPASEGTDPYHDAFGSFCLPSFPMSALESGSSTPLPPPINPNNLTGPQDRSGAEILKSALSLSTTGRRRGRWIVDDPTLTTHHLMNKDADEVQLLNKLTEKLGGSTALTNALLDDTIEYCVTSIPILTTKHVNLEELVERIISGVKVDLPQYTPEEGLLDHSSGNSGEAEGKAPASQNRRFQQQMRYRGVIVTSQRAADAWVEASRMAANRLIEEASARGETHTTPPFTPWPRTPFFAVGPATANALKNAAITLPTPFRPRLVLGGAATGTGEALANYVVKHFADGGPGARPPGYSSPRTQSPSLVGGEGSGEKYDGPPPIEPLLILTGDKNMPTVRTVLSAVGRPKPQDADADTPMRDATEGPPASKPTLKKKELWEMSPIPFEELRVYETSEDPDFDAHLRSFEQSLPPVSSRPTSRRPSASDSDSASGALLSGVNGPPPLLLAAAISGAALPQADSGGALVQPPSPIQPSENAGQHPESSVSAPSSASVSRRSSIKAKILAERLNAVNKAALANGLPSPLVSTEAAVPGTESAPASSTSPQKASPAQEGGAAGKDDAAAPGVTAPSPVLGHSKGLRHQSSQVFASSPLALTPADALSTSPPTMANGTSSGAAAAGSTANGSSSASGSVTPGGYRATGSAPSQARENTLGTLDEDSALTDEALLEHAITVRQAKAARSHKPDWVVFFSPSGLQYALPHLRRRKWMPPEPGPESEPPAADAKPGMGSKYPRIAVLGPTTKSWIRQNLHFLPDAVAATPGPVELREAISLVEKKRRMTRLKEQYEDKDATSNAQ